MTEPSPWIVDVTAASFELEVIARSLELPVLLYFTATWCGPCKELGPVLHERAERGAGRFVLAKVDIDQSPELAQALQVKSVPTVLAVVGGQLTDGFEGAIPPDRVDAFLDHVLPPAEAAGPAPLEEARSLVEDGDPEGAARLLEDVLAAGPADDELHLALADLCLDLGRAPRAQELFEALGEEARATPAGRALEERLAFGAEGPDLDALRAAVEARPDDAAAHLELGQALLLAKRHEEGFEALLGAYRLDPGGVGTSAKQAMLERFDVLGMEDPVANEYRFKLSLELFA